MSNEEITVGLLWTQLKEHEPFHATYLPFTTIIEQEFERSAKIIGKVRKPRGKRFKAPAEPQATQNSAHENQ